jgi:hypothetical protein
MLARAIKRWPNTVAIAIYGIATSLAFWPFWTGRVLLPDMSDQQTSYAFREFAADFVKRYAQAPQWIPYEFGGMPYLANTMHGDTFFPTALLRLVLPVDVGMALGFLLFTFLAGVFAYLFFRTLRFGWAPAFVGGAAYMFSGQVISLASPGHDGKLYVSALLPLALLFLYRAVTRDDWRQYAFFGVTVGFALLTPHHQLTYYLLMAAGFFWLFLVFWSGERPASTLWWKSALMFGGALVVALMLSAIQIIPFLEFFPFSPRGSPGSVSTGWQYASQFSMPPEELVNVLWPAFSGMLDNYWGRNSFKLHSEYLGAAVILLAVLSVQVPARRRLVWFFAGLAAYATLFGFGGHTPFYSIPYTILPFLKSTRAVSMIFFITAFCVAGMAAVGVEALVGSAPPLVRDSASTAKRERKTRVSAVDGLGGREIFGVPRTMAMIAGVVIAASLIGMAGGWRGVMETLVDPQLFRGVEQNYPLFIADCARVILVVVAVAALCAAAVRGRLAPETWGLIAGCVVLLDLWSVERKYVRFSPRASEVLAADQVVAALRADSSVYRVMPLSSPYIRNYLISYRIRTALGYNGQELHRYDEVLGGKNSWQLDGHGNTLNPALWPVLGVKYYVFDQQYSDPQLDSVGGPLETYEHHKAYLYRVRNAAPYAYMVPQALRTDAADAEIISALLDGKIDPRALIIVPKASPAGADSMRLQPAHIDTPVQFREVRPGQLHAELSSPLATDAFLYVAENYYPSWHATVDGKPAPVLRAQVSFMAVPVPAGGRVVDLVFESRSYVIGRTISLITALGAIVIAIWGAIAGKRRRRMAQPQPASAG